MPVMIECVQFHKGHHDTHKAEKKGRYTFVADGKYAVSYDGRHFKTMKVKAGSWIKTPKMVIRDNCLDYDMVKK